MKSSESKKISTIPMGYTAVTPWIISRSTKNQIAFFTAVFGAAEIPGSRITNEEGVIIHVVVQIGDAKVMLFDAHDDWGPTPSFLNIYVKDVEAAYQKAIELSGVSVTKITSLYFGEKTCRILDPFGNLFWINQRVENVDLSNADEMKKRAATPEAIEGIKYIQSSLDKALKAQKKFFLDKQLEEQVE